MTYQLKLAVKKSQDGKTSDVTNEIKPILWQYGINHAEGMSEKKIAGRDYVGYANGSWYMVNGFYEKCDNYQNIDGYVTGYESSCYNSGTIDATFDEESSTVTATKTGYGFNPALDFPIRQRENGAISNQVGCFSCDYYQFFVPTDTGMDSGDYYFSVEDTSFKAMSASGNVITAQEKNDDDLITINHSVNNPGTYNTLNSVYAHSKVNQDKGQSYAPQGENFTYSYRFWTGDSRSNDFDLTFSNLEALLKFDDDGVVPAGEPYTTYNVVSSDRRHFDGFKYYYLSLKKDSSLRDENGGYKDDDALEKASYEDYDFYDSLEALEKNGGRCSAIYAESTGGINGANNYVDWNIPMKVRDDAKIGKVYEQTSETWFWYEKNYQNFDRTTQTRSRGYKLPDADWHERDATKYRKTEYDASGQIIPGSHAGSYWYGNSLLITGGNTNIDIKTEDSVNHKQKTNYDLSKNEYTSHFSVLPSLSTNDSSQKIQKELKVTVTLPKGLTYHMGSSYLGGTLDQDTGNIINGSVKNPDTIDTNQDGTTTLRYTFTNVTTNETINLLHFAADIDPEATNGSSYAVKAVVSCDGFDMRAINNRTDTETITVSTPTANRIFKSVIHPLVEKDQNVGYKINYRNMASTKVNGQILDILPFNGDDRKTSYHGTYKLSTVTIDNTKDTDLDLYYTTNPDIRKKTSSVGLTTDGWTKANKNNGTYNVDASATAFVLKGSINAYAQLNATITLDPSGNSPLDIYSNSAYMSANGWDNEIIAVPVQAQVVKRSLSGTIWYDANQNGSQDNDEKKLSGVTVYLYNDDGSRAKDISGHVIDSVKTDQNGRYTFNNLAKGSYCVKADVDFNTYDLTQTKKPGVSDSINSDAVKENKQAVIKNISLPDISDLPGADYTSDYHDIGLVSYADLTVHKVVKGELGDINKKFTFTFTITKTLTDKTTYKLSRNGVESDIQSGDTFTLASNQSVTIKNIPVGTEVQIKETGTNGYEPTCIMKTGSTSSTLTANRSESLSANSIIQSEPTSLTFENKKGRAPITGINPVELRAFLTLFGVAIGLGALALVRQKNE